MMKIQSPKQELAKEKTKIDFPENSSKNKQWMQWYDVQPNQIKIQIGNWNPKIGKKSISNYQEKESRFQYAKEIKI